MVKTILYERIIIALGTSTEFGNDLRRSEPRVNVWVCNRVSKRQQMFDACWL